MTTRYRVTGSVSQEMADLITVDGDAILVEDAERDEWLVCRPQGGGDNE